MAISGRAIQYGKIFGKWTIKRYVNSGSGGRTAVFEIVRTHHIGMSQWEEINALKVVNIIEEVGCWEKVSGEFRQNYLNEKEVLCEKASQEVQLLYQLGSQSNLVGYKDYCYHDWVEENCFGCDLLIRMDFLDNLGESIKEGITYSESDVVKIGLDIGRALTVCHKRDIIHRDIKPGNIFFDTHQNYKLGDFGIARIIDNNQSANTTTGTRAYAAPEQFGEISPVGYDHRVDIYSLGLTLYELCNGGKLPFASNYYVNEEAIIQRISGKKIPKPQFASDGLSHVILKACAFQPNERYQTIEDFVKDLSMMYHGGSEHFSVDNYRSEQLYNRNIEHNYERNATYKEDYETQDADLDTDIFKGTDSREFSGFSQDNDIKRALNIFNGTNEKQDKALAISMFMEAALQGKTEGQFYYGICLIEGNGIEKDISAGYEWMYRAAEGGDSSAQAIIAYAFYYGMPYPKDDILAKEWFEKAALQGHASSQYELGNCYFNGIGVKRDYSKAVLWFERSANAGNINGQYYLGLCYEMGYGIEANIRVGIDWYEEAAIQGHIDAIKRLGEYYKNIDFRNMVKYYLLGAQQQDSNMQLLLANCFYYGKGVDVNKDVALYWYNKALLQIGKRDMPSEYKKLIKKNQNKPLTDLNIRMINRKILNY